MAMRKRQRRSVGISYAVNTRTYNFLLQVILADDGSHGVCGLGSGGGGTAGIVDDSSSVFMNLNRTNRAYVELTDADAA